MQIMKKFHRIIGLSEEKCYQLSIQRSKKYLEDFVQVDSCYLQLEESKSQRNC